MSFRRTTAALLFSIAAIGIATMLWAPTARAAPLTVTAVFNDKAPAGLDDPIWQQAPVVQAPTMGRENLAGVTVVAGIRAVYTEDSIHFLFEWKDPTKSVVKQSWEFDGTKWTHLEGNEDRLSLLFEISRIDKFATKGCAVTCHGPAGSLKEGRMLATSQPWEKGDLWHWKAATSDPQGYADDGWLTVAGLLDDYTPPLNTGRRRDDGRGGDVVNETDDKSAPLYMRAPGSTPAVPGFLLFEEAVPIADYSVFKPGDRLPYRLPVKPTDSRADVRAVSRWADGTWTVMLSRPLDTGHEDDVVFDPRKRYSFAMALFDDSGDDHSKAAEAMVLEFGR